jgi:RNase P subunit RPR2
MVRTTLVLCDGCGNKMRVPVEDQDDVNYCHDCMPVKEEYDPRLEDRRVDPKSE